MEDKLDISKFNTFMFSINIPNFLLPAICDISRLLTHDDTWEVNRINVPIKARGQGYGRQLMNKLTTWADEYHQTLVLNINPSGPLNQDDLKLWYMKNGFVKYSHSMPYELIRFPKEGEQ